VTHLANLALTRFATSGPFRLSRGKDPGVLTSASYIGEMPHLESCRAVLRHLIAKGDPNDLPLAERAIIEYLAATPGGARKSGLRLLQQDIMVQHGAVVGVQRSFAETVNAYIEKKLAEG
jgi:hypothetical protein